METTYRDCLANDEEEAAYRAALVAMEPEPPIGVGCTVCKTAEKAMQASHMQLNTQRAAAFMSAARACADAAVEAEAVNAQSPRERKAGGSPQTCPRGQGGHGVGRRRGIGYRLISPAWQPVCCPFSSNDVFRTYKVTKKD